MNQSAFGGTVSSRDCDSLDFESEKRKKFGHLSTFFDQARSFPVNGPSFLSITSKGVARIWFRGGATHFGGGGPDPLFFASDPKSQGSPLMYFWLPPDFGGGGGPPRPPPGYALDHICTITPASE